MSNITQIDLQIHEFIVSVEIYCECCSLIEVSPNMFFFLPVDEK